MRHVDIDLIGVPMFVIEVGPDHEFRTLAINRADEAALGIRACDVVGRRVEECSPPKIADHIISRLFECVAKRALHEYDERFGGEDSGRWWRTTLTPVFDDTSGRVVRIVGVSIDITQRKETEELLSDAAFLDPLTGLANRRRFERDVAKAIARSDFGAKGFGLVVVDLDGFKSINDTYGHRRGDDVLRHVAHLLKQVAGAEESVARLGGDEFALALRVSTASELRQRSGDLSRFLNRTMTIAGAEVAIGASLGSALWNGERSFGELFDLADAAMYRQKAARKGSAPSLDSARRATIIPIAARAS